VRYVKLANYSQYRRRYIHIFFNCYQYAKIKLHESHIRICRHISNDILHVYRYMYIYIYIYIYKCSFVNTCFQSERCVIVIGEYKTAKLNYTNLRNCEDTFTNIINIS